MFAYIHGYGSNKNGRSGKVLKELLGARGEVLEPLGWDSNATYDEIYADLKAQILDLQIRTNDNLTLIGSSLGGYLSARFGMDLGLKSVLFNPSLTPSFRIPSVPDLVLDKPINALIFVSADDELLAQNDIKVKALFGSKAQIFITHTTHRVMDYEPFIARILKFAKN